MNEDSIKGLSQEELARHIESLESQAWLKDLQCLKPRADGQDLYRIGYAAGLQSVAMSRVSSKTPIRAAAISSLVSMAATALLMWQLGPGVAPSTGTQVPIVQTPATRQPAVVTKPSVRPEAIQVNRIAVENVDFDLDKVLSEYLDDRTPRRSQSKAVSESTSASATASIESDRMRYVTQRRDWLAELESTVPD